LNGLMMAVTSFMCPSLIADGRRKHLPLPPERPQHRARDYASLRPLAQGVRVRSVLFVAGAGVHAAVRFEWTAAV